MKTQSALAVCSVCFVGALLSLGSAAHAVITFTETVHEADIVRDTDTFLNPSPTFVGFVAVDTLRGSFDLPPFGGGGAGIDNDAAPFAPATADFSTDTSVQFRFQAPAGQQFHVHLPGGAQGQLVFELLFSSPGSTGVTLTPPSALSVAFDGVPFTVDPDANGIDPAGRELLMQGEVSGLTDGMTFTQFTITLDYTQDSGGTAISMAPGTNTLMAVPDRAHVSFLSVNSADIIAPTPPSLTPVVTLEPVPEPGACAVLGLGLLALGRRR